MKIHLKVNSSNQRHTRFTIFTNSANCGTLMMTNEEFKKFHQIIAIGCGEKIDEFISTGTMYSEEDRREEILENNPENLKKEISKILSKALAGYKDDYKYKTDQGSFIRWGQVEKDMHKVIDHHLSSK